MLKDYHVHTVYSDGKNTPEEVVLYAIEKGANELGFSDHSYTFFDRSYCIKKSEIKKYVKEINVLKEKYKDSIKIKVGVEQDFYSKTSVKPFDYAIGSAHYLYKDGGYYEIDGGKEKFINVVKEHFEGDYYSACEQYFNTISKFAKRDEISFIGHFDLIAKYNGNKELFDENNTRYIKAYKRAVDILVKAGKTFEINTGAYRKKLRSMPYPAKPIIKYIKSKGGKFILSSDAHRKEDLFFAFTEFEKEV